MKQANPARTGAGRCLPAIFLLLILFFLSSTISVVSAESNPQVRVILGDRLESVAIVCDSIAVRLARRSRLPAVFRSAGIVRVNGKPYRGTVTVLRAPGGRGVRVINEVKIEDYLRGVVPSEMKASWPDEALRAQAIASRTYALRRIFGPRMESGVGGGMLQSSIADQVYRGAGAESDSTDRAIAATAGLVLVHEGSLVPAYFHSCCGGMSERPLAAWPEYPRRRPADQGWRRANAEVFPPTPDPACAVAPHFGWRWRASLRSLATSLRSMTGLREITDVMVERTGESGRVERFAVWGTDGRGRRVVRSVEGPALRMAVGSTKLKSLLCSIAPEPGAVVFSGDGWGHGVGLCQWGAKSRADRGERCEEILGAYYRGSRIAPLSAVGPEGAFPISEP